MGYALVALYGFELLNVGTKKMKSKLILQAVNSTLDVINFLYFQKVAKRNVLFSKFSVIIKM